jgi:hypothetical protein
MFLRCKVRRKDGKQHRYWSVVENTRVAGGRVAQRHVLYPGEINDTQELAWRRSISVLEDGTVQPRTLSLFPEDRCEGLPADASIVRVNEDRTAAEDKQEMSVDAAGNGLFIGREFGRKLRRGGRIRRSAVSWFGRSNAGWRMTHPGRCCCIHALRPACSPDSTA